MATATPTHRPTDPTPLYALVGATDLAVEGVRHALADAARRQAEVQAELQTQLEQFQAGLLRRRAEVTKLLGERGRLQAEIEQVPALVLGRTLEAAAKAETRYEELAERGKSLLERLRSQKATQDLVTQGKVTISRTKAAVTTARHAAGDVAASARDTVTVGRRQAAAAAEGAAASVAEHTDVAKDAAASTAATARKAATRTRTAAKRAATSARKTASTAAEAAESGADKVGD